MNKVSDYYISSALATVLGVAVVSCWSYGAYAIYDIGCHFHWWGRL